MSGDGRRADEQARRAAQSRFDRPLVLQAGAGTGKTAALVARVVAWALGPGWRRAEAEEPGEPERVAARVLRRVVAITFTEAAAAEMDLRVAEALGAIETGTLPVGVFEDALACPPEARPARAAALRAVLDQMRVHTIHAFCRRLLAESPLEVGLHPQFEVDADESGQKAAVREVVEEALPALFADSDAMLRLAREGQNARQIEEVLLLMLRQGAPPDVLDADPLAPERVARLLADFEQDLAAFLALEAGRLAGLTRAPSVSETATRLAALADRIAALPRDAAGLEALARWQAEAGPDPKQLRGFARGDFRKSGRDALGDDAEALAELAAALHPRVAHLARLDPARLRAAREVLAPLHRRLWQRLRAGGIETFPALLADARDLLVTRPEVAARLRRQIDQLLVDEFQDTDPVQCDVIRALALSGPSEERPGLFLVGDPKQSIYGWRNADLAAYDGFLAEVTRAGGELLSLVVNHRSAPAILEEVSRIIRPVMHAEPGLQPPFEELLPSEANAGDAGFREEGCAPVEHWAGCVWSESEGEAEKMLAADANRVEARGLAAELARLHAAGVPWNEFGLLFRAGTDLELYLEELRRADVPFAVEGDRSYFQRREIIEAGALVRCVLDPNDQLALLTLLRSAVAGVPDAALIPLWARDFPRHVAALHGERFDRDALRALVDEAAAEVPGDTPGIDRVEGWTESLWSALGSLALLRASFEVDPADVFVEKLRGLFFFEVTEAARYLGAYRLANLDRFFRDLLAALEEGEGDPQAILRGLREDVAERRDHEEGRPREALEDAVRISTIHKAKGLAFAHVYLLQLHKGGGGQPEPRIERVGGWWEYELLGARTPGYDLLEARREAVERSERVRTLYVAATRARRRLVLAALDQGTTRRWSAESHAALLGAREAGRPDLATTLAELVARGEASLDAHGARWVFPALREAPGPARALRPAPCLEVAAVRARAEALAARRGLADARREVAFSAPISAAGHEVALASWREGGASDEGEGDAPVALPGPSREGAAAVGTAVHRVLERLDLAGDLADELRRGRAGLEDELMRGLEGRARRRALARAEELLERFERGPLLARLCALAPHVLAREFPVLLPPPRGGPPGYLSGAVDLLYEDPESGELVVADWKTDRAEGAEELAEHAARYSAQGAGYVRAVQEALDLPAPPRFELWFLDAGEILRA